MRQTPKEIAKEKGSSHLYLIELLQCTILITCFDIISTNICPTLLLDCGGFCILAEAILLCTSEVVEVTMTSWNAPSRMGVSQGTFWGLRGTF